MEETASAYPASLDIDYPERSNRLTVIFRIILVIPILVILVLLLGTSGNTNAADGCNAGVAGVGFAFLPLILMILFRQKYPRWWYDWNLALAKFCMRVFAYFILLRDEYPSTDEEQSVHMELNYPDAKTELNRWLPLVKWFLAIPHFVVLACLYLAVLCCTVIAWFAVLFTAVYPKGIHNFVVGVLRWTFRVEAYFFFLTTDRYPPFSLQK
jgi:hypothetical protein